MQAQQMADQRLEQLADQDFSQQMQALRKMGSMSRLLGMLPGMGQHREMIENIDERELDRVEAIIRSITPAERDDPKSSTARVARASPVAPAPRSPT